jgi:hypothetical protein
MLTNFCPDCNINVKVNSEGLEVVKVIYEVKMNLNQDLL